MVYSSTTQVTYTGGAYVKYTNASNLITYSVTNPWISQWINVTLPLWVTITKDISGKDLYTQLNYVGSGYPVWLTGAAPTPDLKVDGKDIAGAALAFGEVPGGARWSPVADVNKDYHVDGKDIALIALNFGY